jgi:hypothetical protein
MKIYHSSLTKEAAVRYKALKPNEKLHVLVSYGRRDSHSKYFLGDHGAIVDGRILDSGTWTLNNSRTKCEGTITLDGYISFLDRFESKLDFYFNFDEDFAGTGFETNYLNQLRMQGQGLSPVPVVHNCYSDEIQRYIDAGHKLIAIGSGELKHASLGDLQMICDKPYRAGVKIHFLGITRFEKLAYIPVYSCDASTWGHSSTRGLVWYWNPLKSGHNKIDKISVDEKLMPQRLVKVPLETYPFKGEFEKYLKTELGFSPKDLMGRKGSANREVANLHFYAQLEKIIDQKHKEQGFKFD